MAFPDLKTFNNFPLPYTKIQLSAWLIRHNWPKLLSLIFSLIVLHQLQLQSPTRYFPKPPFLFEPWASTHLCSLPKTNCPVLKIHTHRCIKTEVGTRTHTHTALCPVNPYSSLWSPVPRDPGLSPLWVHACVAPSARTSSMRPPHSIVLGCFLFYLFFTRGKVCRDHVLFITVFPEANIVLSTMSRGTMYFLTDE